MKWFPMMQYMVAGAGLSAVLSEYFSDVSALERLEYEIEDIFIGDWELDSFNIDVQIRFNNASNQSINSLSVEFDMYVSNPPGKSLFLGKGYAQKKISIAPKSPETYRVETSINYTDIFRNRSRIMELLRGGVFRITIDGEVGANVFFGLLRGHHYIFGFKDFGNVNGEQSEEFVEEFVEHSEGMSE